MWFWIGTAIVGLLVVYFLFSGGGNKPQKMENVSGATSGTESTVTGDQITLKLKPSIISALTNKANAETWGGPLMILGQFLRCMDGKGRAIPKLGEKLNDIGISATEDHKEVATECCRVLKAGINFTFAISWEAVETTRLTQQNIDDLYNIDILGSLQQFKGIGEVTEGEFHGNDIFTPAQLIGECLVWTGKKGRTADGFAAAVVKVCEDARNKGYASTINSSIGELLTHGFAIDY